jgi:hypothetical protein
MMKKHMEDMNGYEILWLLDITFDFISSLVLYRIEEYARSCVKTRKCVCKYDHLYKKKIPVVDEAKFLGNICDKKTFIYTTY